MAPRGKLKTLVSIGFAIAVAAVLFLEEGASGQLLSPAGLLQQGDSFEAAFTYPGETKDPDAEDATLEITLRNTGLRGDTYLIEVTEAPEGWTHELSRYNTVLTGIFLPGEENALINLSAFPPRESDPGDGS
ncbi:MAG: hypothetical protein LBF41_10585, partial [Deltaproteobacteria bacterium]|nr:hypothetical protein [Deltaproteobacteria bacterium]